MAYIIYNKGERSLIDTWLVGASGGLAAGSSFGIGLAACNTGTPGVGSSANKSLPNGTNISTTIAEIGQTTPANYTARQSINRNNAGSNGWPLSAVVTGSAQTVGPQVTFTFDATPNLGGSGNSPATMWFCALSTTKATDDILFGADLSAPRSFVNTDQEKITITYRQT